jgi:hypothetical protein
LDLAGAALADCQKRGFQVAIAFVDPFDLIQVNCFGKSLDRRGRQWVRWSAQSSGRAGLMPTKPVPRPVRAIQGNSIFRIGTVNGLTANDDADCRLRKDAHVLMASLEGEGARKAIPDVDAE